MAVYLIDFENVGSDGLCGTDNLTESDAVYIFYSSNSGRISMQMHQCICNSKANFTYFEITTGGKNALDFQLSSFLGYLISKNQSEDLYIISKDRGFQHVIGFWNDRAEELGVKDLKLIRKVSINAEDSPEESTPSDNTSGTPVITEEAADIILDEENETVSSDVVRSVIQNMEEVTSHTALHKQLVFILGYEQGSAVYHDIGTKTALNRQDFHKKLVAKFGQANGSFIYNKLKKLIAK